MLKKRAGVVLVALNSRRAAAMVEYALLAALVALVASVAVRSIGPNLSTKFTNVATSI